MQTSLAWFLTPGANVVDLVFVAVVYIGLAAGPAAGLIAGAVAGLAQDALADDGNLDDCRRSGVVTARSIIGIGGLAKTVVGFFAGIIGSQFIVVRPIPRALVFFTATVAHAIIFVGLYRMLDQGNARAVDQRHLQLRRVPMRSSAWSCSRSASSCPGSSIAGARWAAACTLTGGFD